MSVGSFLEATAKSKKVVTYQDVINTDPKLPSLDGAWSSHPLSKIFETLDQEDALKNRPFRTSVVVKKDKNNQMPGDGFFEALNRLKKISSTTAADKQRVWVAELNAAHAFPWP